MTTAKETQKASELPTTLLSHALRNYKKRMAEQKTPQAA